MESIFSTATILVLLFLYLRELEIKRKAKLASKVNIKLIQEQFDLQEKKYYDLVQENLNIAEIGLEKSKKDLARITEDKEFLNQIESNTNTYKKIIENSEQIIKLQEEQLADKDSFIQLHKETLGVLEERLNLLSKENFKVGEQNQLMRERLKNLGINDFE